MAYNPNIHNRRSIRLKGYDYSRAGLYFITICVQGRACIFGKISNGILILNDAGKMVNDCWVELPQRFNGVLYQRNYCDHIIRDESSHKRITEYIINNPKNWNNDKFHKK